MAAPAARKSNTPVLAIIVIALVVIMGLIAWVKFGGSSRAPDTGEDVPVERGGEPAVMPESNPGAPVPERR